MSGYDDFTPITPTERREVRSTDGTTLNVEIFGAEGAPTIVLSHGWTCSVAFWSPQIRVLADDYRVVAYDQRGHGASGAPGAAGFSSAGLADDLSAVLSAVLAEGEKALLAGHSMGGMTMIAFAGRHTEQLRRQVVAGLFASTGMSELMARSKIVPLPLPVAKLVKPISAWVIGQPQRGVNKASKAVLKYASLSPRATEAEVDFCARIVEACPPQTRKQFARMLAQLDLAADIADFDVPAVVIAGTKDKLTPIWHTRRLAATLPQLVSSTELDGIGHMTPVQSPEVVTAAILQLATTHLAPRTVVDLTSQDRQIQLDGEASQSVS